MRGGWQVRGSGGLTLLLILALALLASELRSVAQDQSGAARRPIVDVVNMPR